MAMQRRPIPEDWQQAMTIAEHLALAQLEVGTAGAVDLADLRDGLAIAVELARRADIGAEALPVLLRAEAVLHDAGHGPWPMRVQGDSLQALFLAAEALRLQRQMCTLGEFWRASEHADQRREG